MEGKWQLVGVTATNPSDYWNITHCVLTSESEELLGVGGQVGRNVHGGRLPGEEGVQGGGCGGGEGRW